MPLKCFCRRAPVIVMTREGASPPPDGSYGCWSNTAAVRPVARQRTRFSGLQEKYPLCTNESLAMGYVFMVNLKKSYKLVANWMYSINIQNLGDVELLHPACGRYF